MKNPTLSSLLVPITPKDIPNLVSFWRFDQGGTEFAAVEGEPHVLRAQHGALESIDEAGPLGQGSMQINEGQWLNVLRKDCPRLDFHGPEGKFSVVVWVKRKKTAHGGCEFVAGQWNETHLSRQYGLFINISVWGEHNQVCGHMSNVGGPSPGYKYCVDGPMGATPVELDEWSVIGMSYDGQQGFGWLNGRVDARDGLNPYPIAGGLNDGGETGSDFTVGAVDRSGEIGNFFHGQMAGLAVYDRALTPGEMYALAQL